MKRALNANLLLVALFGLFLDAFKDLHAEALRPVEVLSRKLIPSCETECNKSVEIVRTTMTDRMKSDDQMAVYAEIEGAKHPEI